jgi:hypothetical protein
MLDYNALSKQFDELLASFSAKDFRTWLDFDNQRLFEEEFASDFKNQQLLEEGFSHGKAVLCQYNRFELVPFDNSNDWLIVDAILVDNYVQSKSLYQRNFIVVDDILAGNYNYAMAA